VAEPFARLQSVAARRLELVEVIVDAQHAGTPPRLRRSFPLFSIAEARSTIVTSRRCRLWWCQARVLRLGRRGPLAEYCSERCAKWGYNFSPRKRLTRSLWAKARRDERRAAGTCLGCGGARGARAYCDGCRGKRVRRG
jgi:hypothetical protein